MSDAEYRRYLYITEADLVDGKLPGIGAANSFLFDRAALGTPTLPKLAREAMRHRDLDDETIGWWIRTQHDGRRVWVWNDQHEFVGSIIVAAEYELTYMALDRTIERRLPA